MDCTPIPDYPCFKTHPCKSGWDNNKIFKSLSFKFLRSRRKSRRWDETPLWPDEGSRALHAVQGEGLAPGGDDALHLVAGGAGHARQGVGEPARQPEGQRQLQHQREPEARHAVEEQARDRQGRVFGAALAYRLDGAQRDALHRQLELHLAGMVGLEPRARWLRREPRS